MHQVLFGTALLVSFLGGVVALLAPCCVSVMLPAYFAAGFARRTGIAAAAWPARAIQRVLEIFTVPLQGEHFLRRPLHQAQAQGLTIERRERFKLGLTERLAARKPAHPQPDHEETSATGSGEDQAAGS